MRNYFWVIFLLCFAFAKAQLQSSYWYFGINGGVNFSSGTAVAIDDGQLLTLEGCSTISDAQGNLLFYTDGSIVYDRNHNLMPNGFDLKGNSSSTSSSIVIPDPGNTNRFYLFTVDTDDQNYINAEGMHYSIVDMTLNGGFGDIDPIDKNIPLLTITSEKLTAISNASGNGYWIVSHFENQFYAYELTARGLNSTPTISTVAPFIELVTTPFTNVDVSAMRGYIKINARGDKLVAAHFSNNTTADFTGITNGNAARSLSYVQGGELYLYDFDNSNGIVSNPQPLLTRSDGASPYGIEFSENGQFLYVEVDYMTPSTTAIFNFVKGEILQYDLTANNIAQSADIIHTDINSPFRGALQLGLDNKIYHARLNDSFLSVIATPNLAGIAADYRYNDFPLSNNTKSQYGLPIFVQSFLLNGEIKGNNHCFGVEQSFSLNTTARITSIQWDFGDPTSTDNTSVLENPNHIFSAPGTYQVTATVQTLVSSFTSSTTITVFDTVIISKIPEELIACDEGFDTATFDLSVITDTVNTLPNQNVSFFESIDDAILHINEIQNVNNYRNNSSPQPIFIKVSNENCYEIIETQLIVKKCGIIVYNVLTPNNDRRNDTFIVSGLKDIYNKHKIYIFTRFGQKIWEGDNNSPEWDGKPNMGLAYNANELLPAGTYFYVIELNEPNEKPIAGYVYLTY